MQVFKVFCKVLSKHKSSILIYVVIYLIISLVMSRSIQETKEKEFAKVSLKIAVENQDEGAVGKELIAFLEKHNKIKEVPADQEAMRDAMYYQEIDYVLVVPPNFTEQFCTGKTEGILEGTAVPGSSTAALIENEIRQYLDTVDMYLKAGIDTDRAAQLSSEDMEQEAAVEFLEESDARPLPAGFYFFQYIPYVFLVIMILGLGTVMKIFRDKELAARNKCSAMSFFQQNLQFIMGCILFTFGVFLFFMITAVCLYRDYMFSVKGLLSAANALVFSVCAASVAWFCVQLVRSAPELNMMSNVFSLSFSFLGGVFVTLDLMSDGVKQVAKFIPSYWYVIANQEIQKVESLADTGNIYQSFLVVLFFALAFFSVGLLINRMKLRTA
ncbi:ABC transporter permease [Lachnospiraceae bacterium]|nr:ABC transporter permease [Lachnospiraceae bacterium]